MVSLSHCHDCFPVIIYHIGPFSPIKIFLRIIDRKLGSSYRNWPIIKTCVWSKNSFLTSKKWVFWSYQKSHRDIAQKNLELPYRRKNFGNDNHQIPLAQNFRIKLSLEVSVRTLGTTFRVFYTTFIFNVIKHLKISSMWFFRKIDWFHVFSNFSSL